MSHSCENYDTTDPTVLTIEGVYKHGENQALNVSQQVVFRNVVRDNSGNITSQDIIPIQRNHLYKVTLTPKYNNGALVFGEMNYAIQVNDWQTGETLVFAGDDNLTAQSTPSFTVTNASAVVGGTGTDGKTNPTLIYSGVDEHSIYLTVTSATTGTMLESATFPSNQYGPVSNSTTNDANGNLVETYKIDIDDNITLLAEHTFTLSNAINTNLKRTFVLKKKPRVPLEYVSESYVTKTKKDVTVDGNSINCYQLYPVNQSGSCSWYLYTDGLSKFSLASTNNQGVPVCSNGGTFLGYYHLPSAGEAMSIFPGAATTGDAGLGVDMGYMTENTVNSYTEKLIEIGGVNLGNSKTYLYRNYTSVWGIRFEDDTKYGNGFRCAFRYRYVTSPIPGIIVDCIYLGDDTSISSTNLKAKLVDDASFWNSGDVITKTFYFVGYHSSQQNTTHSYIHTASVNHYIRLYNPGSGRTWGVHTEYHQDLTGAEYCVRLFKNAD